MKIRIILFVFFSALFCITLTAQQNNILRGKVVYLSSGKKPAVGVEVSGKINEIENANTIYTSDNGAYKLVFPVERVGYRVELNIGTEDVNQQQLELVNRRETEICRIPARATDEFEIIVCRKGERDLAAQRYYEIIKTSSEKALEQMKREMDALLEQKEKDYQLIAQMSDRISKLEQQADSVAIYKEAFRIASINKDNASERVIKYIDCIYSGETIQNCIHFLDKDEATREMRGGIKDFKVAIEELDTRAISSSAIFNYSEAVACYDSIITILELEEDYINPLIIAEYNSKLAKVLFDDGKFKSALDHQQKCIDLQQETRNVDSLDLSASYLTIGYVYQALGQYDQALSYQLRDISIKGSLLDTNAIELAKSFNNIGMTYYYLGDFDEALKFNQKSLNIKKSHLQENDYLIAQSYRNIGSTYLGLGDYEKSIAFQMKDMEISERVLEPNHPDLAKVYSNLGISFNRTGDYEKELTFERRALSIRKDILDDNHPELANSYNNVANTYRFLSKYDSALIFQQFAIEIMEVALPNHPDLASFYGNAGIIYYYLGEYQNALKFCLKDVSIKENVLGENNPSLALAYLYIAVIYQALDQNEKALEYQYKDIRIKENIYEPNNLNIAYSYGNLGFIYLKMKDYSQALFYTDKAIGIFRQTFSDNHPGLQQFFANRVEIYLLKGQKALEEYDYAAALSDLDSVIILADTNSYEFLPQTYFDIGQCHLQLSSYKAAIENLKKAVVLSPDLRDNKYYSDIGTAYAKNSQFDEAKLAFQAYEENYPNQPEVHLNWLLYYALQKQKNELITHLQKAIELGFVDLDWLDNEESLKPFRRDKDYKKVIKSLERKIGNQ